MTTERVFLNERQTYVSISRIILEGTTYVTANITSVSKRLKKVDNTGEILLLLFGIFFVLLGLVLVLVDIKFGLIILVGLAISVLAGHFLRTNKPVFLIIFRTSAGEIEGLSSPDESFINKVLAAINDAIVARA